MRDRQVCIGCGKKSPETETNYTLISAQFGWRLTRYRDAEGNIVIEWRCPNCWRDYKKTKGEPASGPSGSSSDRAAAPDSSVGPRANKVTDTQRSIAVAPQAGDERQPKRR